MKTASMWSTNSYWNKNFDLKQNTVIVSQDWKEQRIQTL